MTEPEKLYTLDEARKIVKRERCVADGHEVKEVIRSRQADGKIAAQVWMCENGCDVGVQLVYPD